jgi:hypothetical protein
MKHEETPLIPFEIVAKFLPLLLFSFFFLYFVLASQSFRRFGQKVNTHIVREGLICSSSSSEL